MRGQWRPIYQALAMQQALGQQQYVIRSLSAVAAVALQPGELARALQQMDEIMSTVDLAATQQINEPLACALICYQVLQANADPRAEPMLQIAWQRLQSQAATLGDETLRRSFLENVKVNQVISALYAPHNPGIREASRIGESAAPPFRAVGAARDHWRFPAICASCGSVGI